MMGIIAYSAVIKIQSRLLASMPAYIRAGGVQTPSQLREAAMNRKRQKKWRKKSKQVWVTRTNPDN